MRISRKVTIAAAVVVALFVVLATLPYLFRGRIAAAARTQVNTSVNARVNWSGVGLSVLRNFPNVTLSLNGLSIAGATGGPFAADTLLQVAKMRLVLDVGSVVGYLRHGDHIVVREIALSQPDVRLRVLPNGASNWDITRPTKSTSKSSSAVGVTLRKLQIDGASIALDDQQSHLATSVSGLDVSLRGDFGQQRTQVATRTHASAVSVRFAGVPYLTRAALDVNLDVDADMAAHRFTFRNDSVRLNNLVLAFSGTVLQSSPNVGLDVTFSAPSTAFRDMLSLVPAIYAHQFAQLQTTGTMAVSGRVRGVYGPRAFPALALHATVANGGFKYPSLPLAARDVAMDLAIDNPGGSVDGTVVNLKRFHAVIGERPLDAQLVVRTPVSDPDVDARVVGSVSLADVAKTVQLDGVSQLAGVVAANVAVHARVSDVNAQRFDRVSANGTVNVSRVGVHSAAVPYPIAVDTAALLFTPSTAQLTSFAARIGNSDVRAAGALDNVIGFMFHDEDLRGRASVTSNWFDLDQWKSNDKTTDVIPVPPHIDFALAANANRVTYAPLTLTNVTGKLRIKDQRVTIDGLQMQTLGGTVVANGYYESTNPTRPTFDVTTELKTVQIAAAFKALPLVQKIAPIARWATGDVSGSLAMKGPLGSDMAPVYPALAGAGRIESDQVALSGAPLLDKLGSTLSLDQVKNPTLTALAASFDVSDGRVHVRPFPVKMNGIDMTVSGSNGFDQTIQYDLVLGVPRSALGANGSAAVARLASQAGKAGIQIAPNDVVQLGAQVGGTVTSPTIRPNFAGVATSASQAAQYVVRQAAENATKSATQKVDSAADRARERAQAQIMAKANADAATIRAQARTLAAKTTAEANARADSLEAHASNPLARMATKAAADRIRATGKQQADRIVQEGDAKADALVAEASRQADALPKKP